MVSNDKTNILIAGDDLPFLKLLESILNESGHYTLHVAHSFEAGLFIMQVTKPAACMIELEMSGYGGDGYELAKKIRTLDAQMPIILITSKYSEESYLKCRPIQPKSFLNKELSELKLRQAIDLAILAGPRTLANIAPAERQDNIPHSVPNSLNSLFFRSGDHYIPLQLADIAYFHADKKQSFARTQSKQTFAISALLKRLEEELNQDFIRIHKGYLVNTKFIESIHPGDNTLIVAGELLPVGNFYRKSLFSKLRFLK